MNKNTMLVLGGIVVVVAVLVGKTFLANSQTVNQETANPTTISDTANQQATNPAESEEKTSWYTAYSPEALAAATVDDQKAVIFFHASWCPTCKAASEDFQSNIGQIPSDVTILKADYDTRTELKKKYGVVMQDTFVQVDSQGNALATWNSGGEGIKTLLANVR
ncbi:thioredoxin family protein [Candidatus Roizmanbacteria bacterium]|nr:thioredoxin family protein [Candidatus Roizmanbacteria bacterium]